VLRNVQLDPESGSSGLFRQIAVQDPRAVVVVAAGRVCGAELSNGARE